MPHQCAHWFAMTDLVGVCAPGGGSSVPRFCQGTRIATPRRPKVRHAQLRPKARVGQRSLVAPLPTKGAPLRGPHALVRNDRLGRCVRTRGRQQCTTFLPGDADCRTSSPQSPPCRRPKVRHAQLRPKTRAGQRSLGAPLPTKGAPLRGPYALVCNDMQKAGAWLRVQGRFPAVPWYDADTRQVIACHCVVASVGTQQVLACHCEERSDVAIRTPCSSTKRNATIPGEYAATANLPKVLHV